MFDHSDANGHSVHVVNVAGQRAVDAFVPTAAAPGTRATVQVTVTTAA